MNLNPCLPLHLCVFVSLALCTGLSSLAGCGDAHADARKLIEPLSFPGKAALAAIGSDENLVRSGRISAHHRVEGFEDTGIDCWVLRHTTTAPSRGIVLMLHGLAMSKS